MNEEIDPFIVFLNSNFSEKQEGENFIQISDINEFFKLNTDEFTNLIVILDECAKIPKKFGLEILEMNYLFCTIVWKNGF